MRFFIGFGKGMKARLWLHPLCVKRQLAVLNPNRSLARYDDNNFYFFCRCFYVLRAQWDFIVTEKREDRCQKESLFAHNVLMTDCLCVIKCRFMDCKVPLSEGIMRLLELQSAAFGECATWFLVIMPPLFVTDCADCFRCVLLSRCKIIIQFNATCVFLSQNQYFCMRKSLQHARNN